MFLFEIALRLYIQVKMMMNSYRWIFIMPTAICCHSAPHPLIVRTGCCCFFGAASRSYFWVMPFQVLPRLAPSYHLRHFKYKSGSGHGLYSYALIHAYCHIIDHDKYHDLPIFNMSLQICIGFNPYKPQIPQKCKRFGGWRLLPRDQSVKKDPDCVWRPWSGSL